MLISPPPSHLPRATEVAAASTLRLGKSRLAAPSEVSTWIMDMAFLALASRLCSAASLQISPLPSCERSFCDAWFRKTRAFRCRLLHGTASAANCGAACCRSSLMPSCNQSIVHLTNLMNGRSECSVRMQELKMLWIQGSSMITHKND